MWRENRESARIMKVYNIQEVIDKLTICFHNSFESLTLHLIEEIGEIAAVLVRGQNMTPRFSKYPLSDIYNHINEFSEEERTQINQYSEFFRWSQGFNEWKFKEKLEKELIDVIMMVAIYPKLAEIKGCKIESIGFVCSFKFNNKKNECITDSDCFKAFARCINNLIGDSLSLDYFGHDNGGINVELVIILKCIEQLCFIHNIDVNQGIHNKLFKELKEEKRSNV